VIKFAKYHGCGNDFLIVTDGDIAMYLGAEKADVVRDGGSEAISQLTRELCARNTGIGGDGLIIVKQNPLEMIIYNSDGSRAPMCGNGIRCFAAYCADEEIAPRNLTEYPVETLAGPVDVKILSHEPFLVEIGMGLPDFDISRLGISAEAACAPAEQDMTQGEHMFINREIIVDGGRLVVTSVFMGTIHTVVWLDDIEGAGVHPWTRINGGFAVEESLVALGRRLSEHPIFSEKTNVNLAHVLNADEIELITYERGAGLTAACGTGACAVVVIGSLAGRVKKNVTVRLPYGKLEIRQDDDGQVFMTGPAERIATGAYLGGDIWTHGKS
jgi:diaminopimelate epimerase